MFPDIGRDQFGGFDYLRRMCKVYQENNLVSDWQSLLGGLRREHKAKRRLMEVLDGLSGKRIID